MKRIALKQSEVPLWLSGATELRVVVKPQPEYNDFTGCWTWNEVPDPYEMSPVRALAEGALVRGLLLACPYPIGSELALTETWATDAMYDDLSPRDLPFDCSVQYKATIQTSWYGHWRSPVTMPAEFSRFIRRVAGVRVEHGELWEWVLTLEVKHG